MGHFFLIIIQDDTKKIEHTNHIDIDNEKHDLFLS